MFCGNIRVWWFTFSTLVIFIIYFNLYLVLMIVILISRTKLLLLLSSKIEEVVFVAYDLEEGRV